MPSEQGALLSSKVGSSVDYSSVPPTPRGNFEPNVQKPWIDRYRIVFIETALFANVFLSGLDGTITASTYQLIGNEFDNFEISNWITTAYLVATTSFQPLYGSFSDTLGRRHCLFFANTVFALGCLGCGLAPGILSLIFMRALTGIGGGGLITLSTIVNSDIIPPESRGIYQAFQNVLLGIGAVIGASTGGAVASYLGWRWCFLLQVPVSVGGTIMAYMFLENQKGFVSESESSGQLLKNRFSKIDLKGSLLLIVGLASQLMYLTVNSSMASSGSQWLSKESIGLILLTVLSLVMFIHTERTTQANPIIPTKLLSQSHSTMVLVISVLVGFVSYAYLFTLPLFFQIVVGDSAARAGFRLAIPSFCTPIGGLITGLSMRIPKTLPFLLSFGMVLMMIGNAFFLLLKTTTPEWLVCLLLTPANVGQGVTFPATLFSFLFSFHPENQATATSTLYLFRSIGSLWGVAGTSGLIQLLVGRKIREKLHGILSPEEIARLRSKIGHKTSYIEKLPSEIKEAVVESYESAIKFAHILSVSFCVIAIGISIVRHFSKGYRNLKEHNDPDLESPDRRNSVSLL